MTVPPPLRGRPGGGDVASRPWIGIDKPVPSPWSSPRGRGDPMRSAPAVGLQALRVDWVGSLRDDGDPPFTGFVTQRTQRTRSSQSELHSCFRLGSQILPFSADSAYSARSRQEERFTIRIVADDGFVGFVEFVGFVGLVASAAMAMRYSIAYSRRGRRGRGARRVNPNLLFLSQQLKPAFLCGLCALCELCVMEAGGEVYASRWVHEGGSGRAGGASTQKWPGGGQRPDAMGP
jgi:hypothetical protein